MPVSAPGRLPRQAAGRRGDGCGAACRAAQRAPRERRRRSARPPPSTSNTAITWPTETASSGRRPHLLQHAADDRFDLHRRLVGLDLQHGLAALDLLARLGDPAHDADLRLGRRQVGHFHLETHISLPARYG